MIKMNKNKIRLGTYLYPMPVVLIGANVNGKPNFMPIAWASIVEHNPPMIAISSYETHHTNQGIKENRTFSVNTPSEGMVEITDYCGLVTGKETDKSEIFDIFYGELKTAPMIVHSPINLECEVVKIIDIKEFTDREKGHELIIGKIIQAYADEYYLTNDIPDITKLKPFVYSNDGNYWKLGEHLGKAFSIGQNYKKE